MKKCHLMISDKSSRQIEIECILEELYGLTTVSVLDLFNHKLRNESESDLAISIMKCLNEGRLVPTKLITRMIEERIGGLTSDILITHYPRTKEQFIFLNKLLEKNEFEINRLWLFECQNIEELILERASQNTSEEMIKKSLESLKRITELEKFINKPEITSRISYKYPDTRTVEQIKTQIIELCKR